MNVHKNARLTPRGRERISCDQYEMPGSDDLFRARLDQIINLKHERD